MLESKTKQYWLYLWKKRILLEDDTIVTRVCYGITSNLDRRRHSYEGHNGHLVQFCDLWTGPERPIRERESRLKSTIDEYSFRGYRNFKYEWLNEEITIEQIKGWIEWELNEFPSITKDDVSK